MNKAQIGAFVVGVGTIVGGGYVAKYLDATAGAALIGAGAFFLGKVTKQPRAFHSKPAAPPTDEHS